MKYAHAAPTFAFRARPLTLALILSDGIDPIEQVVLSYEADGEKQTIRMLPTDGYRAEESYSLYTATVPAAHLSGTQLSYCFQIGGEIGESYTVLLETLPDMPPFVLTEAGTEMWQGANFYELCNPGEQTVDLFDYELLLERNGKIEGRNPLADRAGESLLAGGEAVAFRPLRADRLNTYGTPEAEMRSFWDTMAEFFPAECGDLSEHMPRVLTALHATRTEEGWAPLAQTFPVGQTAPHHLHLVPRGAGLDSTLYSIPVNCNHNHRDVAARTASLWDIDMRNPAHGYMFSTKRNATPGFACEGQALPFVGDSVVPAILPLHPGERFYLSEGEMRIRFAVFAGGVGVPSVRVLNKGESATYAAFLNEEGLWEAVLPLEVLSRAGGMLSYCIEVRGRCYTARLGSDRTPLTVRITDNAGPVITALYPADGQAVEGEQRPEIRVSCFDGAGLDPQASMLCLDGINVAQYAKWTANGACYRAQKPLSDGKHTLELSLRDRLGNRTYRRTEFFITDGKELNFYRGEVHSHTIESDGRGTVKEAFEYARDVGKVDYFAVTDHCCYLIGEEVQRQKKLADAYNENGRFATLYGYEVSWSKQGFWGHMNVLGGDWFLPAATTPMPKLYDKLESDPNVIAMFNHPCDNWGDFDSFSGRTDTLDRRIHLIEAKKASFDDHYAAMLTRGWHAAPVVNEDNHYADWTTKTKSTGVVLAHSLTRENIMDGMRRGRTYATMDNTMRIRYRMNGEWLGTRLQKPKRLTAEIEIVTDCVQGIGDVMLVAEDNIVVARMHAGALKRFTWSVELAPDFDYYYLKVQNGATYSVTSPVFVEGWEGLAVTELAAGVSDDPALPHAVCATVKNTSDSDLSDATADFYLTPTGGFDLREQMPFASVRLGTLKAGETRSVTRHFPNVVGNRRVSVVVSGMDGKRRLVDTRFLLLSPAWITKICPLTSSYGKAENPFPYVELYNPTCVPLPLDGYVLNGRHEQGDFRPMYRVLAPLDGYCLPPEGTLTVWCRPAGSALTAADFNARYGTSLVEGRDLMITEQPILMVDEAGHTLDLCLGEEHLCRAAYGDFCGGALPIPDVPEQYCYRHDITIRTLRLEGVAPVPLGDLTEQQVPPILAEQPRPAVLSAPQEERVVTKLSKTPLVPLRAATFLASAFSTFKGLLSDKD